MICCWISSLALPEFATGPAAVKLTAMSDGPENKPDPVEKSLGDQVTGSDVSHIDRELSLGNQSTSGDALSSMSDLTNELSEGIDADLPLINLTARYQIDRELGQGGMGAEGLTPVSRHLRRRTQPGHLTPASRPPG